MKRADIISGTVEARVDIRKMCNASKRMSSIMVAAATTGIPVAELLGVTEGVAVRVLKGIGFDTSDEHRLASVMPMMLEAASGIVASSTQIAGRPLSMGSIKKLADVVAESLVEVAKSRYVAKAIESEWPAEIDEATSIRIAAVAAMSSVACQVVQFDYMHKASECIREASKVVVGSAIQAAAELTPAKSSGAAKVMLVQSLISSGAKVYAAIWEVEAINRSAALDSMPAERREAELDRMAKTPLSDQLARVREMFTEAFDAVKHAASQIHQDGIQDKPRLPARRSALGRMA